MPTQTSRKSDALSVLIAGGGVAGLEAMLALRHLAEERVQIDLLSADTQFWYRPLAVGEPFGLGEVHGLDLGLVADDAGAGLVLGSLRSVDADAHVVRTAAGAELEYDVLLIAVGARPVPAVPGALTFRGPADTGALRSLVSELTAGEARRVVFALPGGAGWPLPVYELALQTAALLRETRPEIELILVTPEEQPLELFGPAAGEALISLLAEHDIQVFAGSYPIAFDGELLSLKPVGEIVADRVIALPRLEGPDIDGIARDTRGFIRVDMHSRVHGLEDVFAAGDATSFPVKQGGLASQQADAAAETIAALAGADIVPTPFRPVLRGVILTGGAPLYARTEIAEMGRPAAAGSEALWWPPAKIVGRHLAPYLAEHSETILARSTA
jgi:sulfide:quinone oxidoreductase